jgi:hypothetical protein
MNGVKPILGRHPSVGKVNTYFALCEVGHATVSYLLPKKIEVLGLKIPARNLWQAVWFGIEAGEAYHNYQGGIRIRF